MSRKSNDVLMQQMLAQQRYDRMQLEAASRFMKDVTNAVLKYDRKSKRILASIASYNKRVRERDA